MHADFATIRAALTDSYLIATRDESRLHGDEDAYACFQRALDGDDEALDQIAEEIEEGVWSGNGLGLDLPAVGARAAE